MLPSTVCIQACASLGGRFTQGLNHWGNNLKSRSRSEHSLLSAAAQGEERQGEVRRDVWGYRVVDDMLKLMMNVELSFSSTTFSLSLYFVFAFSPLYPLWLCFLPRVENQHPVCL